MRRNPRPSLVVLLALVATNAWASIFGEEDSLLATLIAQGVEAITQAQQVVTTARDDLQLARDVYAGVNTFINFDPDKFLSGQQDYWLAQVPVLGDAADLVNDVRSHGLSGGHFDPTALYERLNAYGDVAQSKKAYSALGGKKKVLPYNAAAALSAAKDLEALLADPGARSKLANAPDPQSVSEGLFDLDAANLDPQLLTLYLQHRGLAKEAEQHAFEYLKETSGASPGKSQQLAAMAAALTAQEAARIDGKLSQSLAIQQLERAEDSVARSLQKKDTDFLWSDAANAATTYKAPDRGSLDLEHAP